MSSVAIIGTGRVGSTVAYSLLYSKHVDELVLIDIFRNLAEGEKLDIGHAAASLETDVRLSSSDKVEDAEGCELIIVTAGYLRKPDMTRMDLLEKNLHIMEELGRKIKEFKYKPVVIVVTNPIDVLAFYLQKKLGFPWGKVIGFGSSLDTARLRFILSQKLGKSVSSIQALVIGEHGEHMVPLFSRVTVEGNKVKLENVHEIREELIGSAARVISLKRGTWFGPAACIKDLVEKIITDSGEVVPVSVDPKGRYGAEGLSIGVPCRVSTEGVTEVVELDLAPLEETWFKEATRYLEEMVKKIR